jgi:N,N-dimethylformamidase
MWMTDEIDDIALLGYSDRLSARPGETIEFKVSCTFEGSVEAWLTRSICADPNPASPGIVEESAEAWFAPHTFPARHQHFHRGSYAVTEQPVTQHQSVRLLATVFPMLAKRAPQTIMNIDGLTLCLDEAGAAAIRCGDTTVSSNVPLKLRNWYRLEALYDGGTLAIRQTPMRSSGASTENSRANVARADHLGGLVSIAARLSDGVPCDHFNGKIEAPAIYTGGDLVAAWDFSRDIPTTIARDTGPQGLDARLINFPARGMTGSTWDGSEMCWRHAPDQYAAVHFHEDDVYDFGWETDFSFTVPQGMPSGVYVMHLKSGANEDAMPFYVCAPKGKPTAKLCVLIPTFTYVVYGNHARPDFAPSWVERIAEWGAYPHNPAEHRRYGLSTYNFHPDGSGICHASHRRPLFNLRPGYLTFGSGNSSGLRHFQADSHLITWLHAQGIDYDVITDRELHDEGIAAIAGYSALMTTSHPEYHTVQTLDALQSYRDTGGNLIYLGGNGFYWRVATHSENDGMIEIRRAEDGLRAWAAEPGEYYNAFDGTYGGLWRRSGRPPQMLAGVGFTAQGAFNGSYYRRKCHDPAYEWIFEGVEGDTIGDFGLSGGGAAGFELDRYDPRLGSPENAVILASSEGHGNDFILVPEEQLTHITNWAGEPVGDLLRADMIYFELPEGGRVFSVGSITFCGSLLENGCGNNVSRILRNIVRQMAT